MDVLPLASASLLGPVLEGLVEAAMAALEINLMTLLVLLEVMVQLAQVAVVEVEHIIKPLLVEVM